MTKYIGGIEQIFFNVIVKYEKKGEINIISIANLAQFKKAELGKFDPGKFAKDQ